MSTEQAEPGFLQKLNEKTRHLSDPHDIMAAVAAQLGQHLQVSRCAYADVAADGDHFTIHKDYTCDCESVAGNYHLRDFGSLAESTMRSGDTLVINDVSQEVSDSKGMETFAAIDIAAIICCPLIKQDKLVAMMAVHKTTPRQWRADEIALVEEVVERCWAFIERARAEKLALRNEQQFRDLLEMSPDAIVLVNDQGQIQLCNRLFENLFDRVNGNLPGTSLAELLPTMGHLIDRNRSPEHSVGEQTQQQVIRRSDGRRIDVEIRQNVIESETGPMHVLSVRDISERLGMEAELRHSKKMETVGLLAGGVAHAFNNLLTVIINTVELELMNDTDLPHETRQSLKSVRDAGISAGKLTQQLLALSRQQVLEPEVVNLNKLTDKLQPMIESVLGERIELNIQLQPNLKNVRIDKNQFEQVLLNLVVNARDAIDGSGQVSITTRNVTIRNDSGSYSLESVESGSTGQVALIVSDNGSGMSQDQLEHLFEPFYTTKRKNKGTGLGLATVYGIVKQSGGEIKVKSEPGRGTEFSIYFPITNQEVKSGMSESKEEVEAVPTQHILVVEDEEALRYSLVKILQGSGYDITEADCGETALQLLKDDNAKFDLVICDVVMPGIDGLEVARCTSESHPGLPLILTSGYSADMVSGQRGMSDNCHFLSKPYSFKDLRLLIRRVLEQADA